MIGLSADVKKEGGMSMTTRSEALTREERSAFKRLWNTSKKAVRRKIVAENEIVEKPLL